MKPARHASKWPPSEPVPLPDPFGLTPEQRHRCARTVASRSTDAEDCALLLEVLGLKPADGLVSDRSGH
ncbi:hypothetical protein [Amycolatopsis sp. NBC_01480]|uniref:hypothetical protein n=1 Tax=Amycolatopsis sp. NBC_01480 TaxID=2903562 RepID=UPI002E2A5B5C|nr:hypothetical protein [Amycolatopsis sp. NBC_01480]